MSGIPFDVYTMDLLEEFRQKERKKYEKLLETERILTWLMNIFQITRDEATAYVNKNA